MPVKLDSHINDLEKAKFLLDPDGNIAVRTVVVSTLPTPPTLLSVTPANEKNTLSWSAVAGATDYVIYRDTESGVTLEDTEIITGSISTTYEDTGLTNGIEYFYRVLAVGAWGNTALGNEVSATPLAYDNQLSTLFDGIDEFVTFGDNHNFENNVAYSLSLWVKPTNLAGSRKTLWAKSSNDANVFGWGWYLETSGELFLQMRASGQTRQHSTSDAGPLVAGTWYNLGLAFDGSQNINGVTLYVNGSPLAVPSSGVVTNTLITTDASQIARRNTTFPLNANIDEVTFWDKKLSAAEWTELYNLGSPDDPTNHSASANLIHWYKCGDDDTFPTWTDNQGSVDGTMTNMESGDIEADVP